MKETIVSPCAQWATKLAARHAHDLTSAERIELNRHLSTCAACASIYTTYAIMETGIRSLPVVAPLARLPLPVLEGDSQTISSGPAFPAFPVQLRTRENSIRHVSRRPVSSHFRQLQRSLEMGLALACVACIILVSLALFQRAHTSTGAMSPQDIYHQAISGRPVLSDPMTGPYVDTLWDQGTSCQYAGGAFHVMAPQKNNGTACFDQSSNFSNFAFQVKMTILKGDTGGIIFRFNNNNLRMYEFTINTDDTYALIAPSSTSNCKPLASGYSPAIRNGLPQSNTLTVIARSSSIYVYINGQFVAQAQNSTSLSGAIGLYAFNVTQNTDVEFRDVKVWQL